MTNVGSVQEVAARMVGTVILTIWMLFTATAVTIILTIWMLFTAAVLAFRGLWTLIAWIIGASATTSKQRHE